MQVLIAVMALLRTSGLGSALKAQVEAQLLAELPANLAAKVRDVLADKRMQDSLPKPRVPGHHRRDRARACRTGHGRRPRPRARPPP